MTAVVALRGVRVQYGTTVALDGFDLEVVAGERVALVGASGAGKSTVLRLCTGSATPSAGTVEVFGQDLAGAGERELRRLRTRVAAVHQQLQLVGPLKVVHNVNAGRLGSWSSARALRSLLRPLDVDDARRALAGVGLATKLLERTDRLSGGEQQRVALARALIGEPELIVADEPVSSLDPARSGDVMERLAVLASEGRRTLVVSLHDFELARRCCDRLVGLREGRVAFDLAAAEVTGEHGRELYRMDE